jgi:polyhydroxyalkanoate synthase
MMDILRRSLGNALGAFGLNPDECPYRIIGFGPHWRLRDYGGHNRSLSLLIVTAPIKRAYIWDLAPSVSAVRYCMRAGLHVHLLEWMPASHRNQNNGLDEYTEAVSKCVARISGGAADAYFDRKKDAVACPRLKFTHNEDGVGEIAVDHVEPRLARTVLTQALGSTDTNVANVLASQLASAVGRDLPLT